VRVVNVQVIYEQDHSHGYEGARPPAQHGQQGRAVGSSGLRVLRSLGAGAHRFSVSSPREPLTAHFLTLTDVRKLRSFFVR